MKRTGLLALIFVCFAWQPPAKKFIDPANMDVSIKPGDNFYRYANGNWIKNNPVPPSKVRWGSFDNLFEETRKRLQTLLETAAAKASTDPASQKIGDFFTSGMDSLTIEKRGFEPIKPEL